MNTYKDNQEFYQDIERTLPELLLQGFESEANKIDVYLHSAWTTSSELFGELKLEFKKILKKKKTNKRVTKKLKCFVKTIDDAWNRANK